jgi:transglutaminase-like putative cysteine protease
MRIRVGCEFVYEAAVPTHAVLQVEPRLSGGVAALDERWETVPQIGLARYVDGYDNLCRRATIGAGTSSLRYDALLEVPDAPDPENLEAVELAPRDLPDDVLVYTLPSRYCPSYDLADPAWDLFGSMAPGWRRVQAISDWVHDEISFDYLATRRLFTAADIFEKRAGVCRDFAHLAVTFCRALNIPARYAFGYLPEIDVPPSGHPRDFCAWTEVFLDGAWWTFDPRNNQRRRGRTLVGRGRDAVDVPMVCTYGGPKLTSMTVWADLVTS